MRNKLFIFLLIIGMWSACKQEMNSIPESGVSRELAIQRKAEIKELEYHLRFSVPAEKIAPVIGEVEVFFSLERASEVVLDFREKAEHVKEVRLNGKPADFRMMNEHIMIPAVQGNNQIDIEFIAGDQSLNRNEEYLYTLLVPDRARTLFPCFDQPDLKAEFSLILEIPGDWVAVANGPAKEENTEDGRKRIVLKKTEPLSTYLFSFVAGKWSQLERTAGGKKVTLYHRETDPTKLAQTDEIFEQVFEAMEWMEDYTGIPYPFTKYDLVIVPGFQFGGMEHAGAVLYNDRRIFLSEHPSLKEQLGRMELISHETAHMWFGDYVTMEWFNDVWTKEVFANYFAARMCEPRFPDVNHQLNALSSFYPAAYSEDRTLGTNAIRQPLKNLNDAGLIYGQIVYNKAPIVMSKLVELMGEDNFRQGIQEYLRTYAYSNATWNRLIRILDRYTPENLMEWSRVWVDEKGMPEIGVETQERQFLFKERDRFSRQLVWPQKVAYAFLRKPEDGRSNYDIETISVVWKDSVTGVEVAPGVEYVIPNMDGTGYGYFELDPSTLTYCLEHWAIFTNPLTRLSLLISLNENYLNGRIDTDRFVESVLKPLATEQEPLVFMAALGYVKEAYRMQMGKDPDTERELWQLVHKESPSGYQQAAFRTLSEIWTLPEITQDIYQLWSGNKSVRGLTLSERDEMKAAYELAIRMPERYLELINEQSRRITNPDRNREFCLVAQAVVADTIVLDSLFQSLLLAENRRVEPWVEQMLYYLNHPLRQQQALKYIRPALESLQEVQQTGDIFFPRNWVNACLRGHHSTEASRIVQQFLEEHPDYPQLLKNKILQSADHLYRR